jgi:foldase protein PrsA
LQVSEAEVVRSPLPGAATDFFFYRLELMTLNASRRLAGLSALALAALLSACSSTDSSGGGDIASVNGQPIGRADFYRRLDATPVAKQTLNQLVQGALIDQYAKDHNITIPDADVNKKFDEIKSKYPAGQFDNLLATQGLTVDDVRRILKQQLVLEQAMSADVKISDKDVSDYFAKNAAQFDTPEQVHASHILVADLKTANEVEAQLKSGAKFADLAKKYSTDPSSKDKGGDLGFFGRKQMVPSFEKAAFSQPLNVVGQPVKSPFGYHVILVTEHKQAVKATLANSKDAITKQLKQQKLATAIPSFLATLKSKAKITINEASLKEVGNSAAMPAAGQ